MAILAIAFAFCGWSEEAVLCEESAAHLSECCPGFEPRHLECQGPQFPSGCSSVDVESDQARCIVNRSCAELQADGTCARAITQWTKGDFSPEAVCR